MSTKTTLKRIALVAVSALGFGVLTSVSPASAGIASSMSLTATSITVVGTSTPKALVGVTVNSDTASTGLTAGETVTVSVIGVPTSVTTTKTRATNGALGADLTVTETTGQTSGTFTDWTVFTADTANGTQSDTDGQIGSANSAYYGLNQATPDASTVKYRTYFFSVTCTANCLDQGVYTLALDLSDAQGAIIQRSTLKIDFVSAAADSGAVVTATSTGAWVIGDTPSIANQTSTRRLSATLRNRDGGAIRANDGSALALSVTLADSSTTKVVEVLTPVDDRTNEFGYSATQASNTALANDGNFSIYKGSAFSAVTGPGTMTVRYGLASATATVTLNAAATSGTTGAQSVTATGQIAGADANDAYLPLSTKSAVASIYVANAAPTAQTGYAVYYTVSYSTSCVAGNMSPTANTTPVKVLTDSTGTASVTITNAFPLDTCVATVTWTGVATPDASGASLITWQKPAPKSAIPNPGGSYQALFKSSNTVTWTIVDQFGAVVTGVPVQLTLSGANAPTAALATKTSDASGQVSHTWTDAKGSATATSDTISVTSINGLTSGFTTGAISVNYKTALDKVASLKAVYQAPAAIGGSPAAVSVDTLVPSTNIGGAKGISISKSDQLDLTGTFPSPAVGAGDPWVKLVFTALDADVASVSGIPTTVKVTNGFLIDSLNRVGTERIVYANDTIWILGLKAGVTTVTATNGTLTSTAKINFANEKTDARVISLSESAGTVTASVTDFYGNPVASASLTAVTTGGGRLGNGSSSDTFLTNSEGKVEIGVTGKATVTVSFNTADNAYAKASYIKDAGDAAGTVVTPGSPAGVKSASIATNGLVNDAKVAADAATAAADAATAAAKAAEVAAVAAAEKAAKDAVAASKAAQDAAVAAAEKAAKDAVAASKAAQDAAVAQAKAAQDAAEAATDAAAEAIDAANAATDAGNLAAEAADAATVAAEEARDAADAATAAVEELATQVATLMAALKAQITTLANTVAKIAKKVKA